MQKHSVYTKYLIRYGYYHSEIKNCFFLEVINIFKNNILIYQKIVYISISIIVSAKHVKLNIEMDIEIPTDLLENKDKIRVIEDGLIKCISKGLYQEGISFHINKFKFHV